MKKSGFLLPGLLLLATWLVALSGCMPSMSPLSTSSSDGSVVLRLSDARVRTIAPSAESLTIATYDITFTRPGKTPVTLSVPGSTTQTQPIYLKPGDWSVTVTANNSTPYPIGVATGSLTVTAGQTSAVTLTILSLVGEGTLTLSADTRDVLMDAPSLTGFLTPGVGGDPIPVTFSLNEAGARYSESVSAGSYLLQLVLKDGTQTLANYVDTVLVVAGLPTAGNLSIKAKQGAVVIELVDQITRPIPITLSGAQSTLSGGATMTVTATPALPVDSYQWYLDGVAINGATSNQVTVGSGLDAGEYTLTVVVKKGSLYSSESVDFTVVSAAPQVATPSFSPEAGTYTSPQSVTISTTTSGATIRYTTDGSTPSDTTGTVYSAPISVTVSQTLKAIAYESGWVDSAVATATYTLPGSSWTTRTLPSLNWWYAAAYGNGVFVAITGGTLPNTAAAYSTDNGATWIATTMPSSQAWSSVAYGNDVFVAIGWNGSVAATSPDGITWTQRTLPIFWYWADVTYGNGAFVAITNDNNVAATSPDGITWTQRTLPSSQSWRTLSYGNGTFVAVTQDGNVAATSPNGITWTQTTLPSSQAWLSLAYGNGTFVALAYRGNVAATSPDGFTWTQTTLPSSQSWRSVTYGSGVFVAVSGSTTGAMWRRLPPTGLPGRPAPCH